VVNIVKLEYTALYFISMASTMTTNGELQIKLAYLELLTRLPTESETNEHLDQLNNGDITIEEVRSHIRTLGEYAILMGTYHGDLEYSTSTVYDVNLSNYPTTTAYADKYNGVMVANGKIGFVTSAKPNRHDASFITAAFDFDNVGQYSKNTIDAFNYGGYDLFELQTNVADVESSGEGESTSGTTSVSPSASPAVVYTNVEQGLNMYRATVTNSFDCVVDGETKVRVSTLATTLRQYPYCALHKITFTNVSGAAIDIPFYHKIVSDYRHVANVRYNNNIINHSRTANTHFFNAIGEFISDTDERIVMAVNNCYLVATTDPATGPISQVTYKGYNMDRTNNNFAYNQLNVSMPAGDQGTVSIYIISCLMTEKDFRNPERETTRILVNILNKTPEELLSEHNREWASIWDSKIVVEGRTDLDTSTEEYATSMEELNQIKRYTYYSLYNIYSVTRDDINVEVNPLNLSTLDTDGNLFWNSELWVIPVLIFLKPKIARTLLNFRFQQLERARKLAIAHGFKGAQFPYENDHVNYNDLYWSSVSPLHIFNTALIAVNTWNYFRVTRDVDWLRSTGYKILKNIAEFFQSKVEYDESIGSYGMKNTIGYNNIQGDNNLLTNYLGKLALKYAMEASYELNYIPDARWGDALRIFLPITASPTVDEVPNAVVSINTDQEGNQVANVFVNLEKINSIDTYVFYNGTEETDATYANRLGHTFGQPSGFYLVIPPDVQCTFHLSTTLISKPIAFFDLAGDQVMADEASTVSTVNSSINNVLGYHSGIFIPSGSEPSTNRITSYKNFDGDFLNNYGKNAITTDPSKVNLTNLMRINDGYAGEPVDLLEQFIVMHPYYSRHFFTMPSVDRPYNMKTVRDNLLYYNDKLTTTGQGMTFNRLLRAGLQATIAQDEANYSIRKIHINTFYSELLTTVEENTTKPWGAWRKNTNSAIRVQNNVSFSALHILNLLTTIGGLRVTGSINESRYYTEEYGIKQRSGYVMPETWKSMKITGVGGVRNAEFVVQNTNFLSSVAL
jgi:trehalose/maltose hydrolase-like predicted phosphorylase